jgi:hypothetical protein
MKWRATAMASMGLLSGPGSAQQTVGASKSEEFASVLEQCIRSHAVAAAESFPSWANSCLPPTEKIDRQARIYFTTLSPIRERYGYTAALWCAFCETKCGTRTPAARPYVA